MAADVEEVRERAARYRGALVAELAPLDLAGAERDRAIVWCVISELFLDTEHDEEWLRVLAAVLAESPFTAAELWVIHADEVAPVLWPNLLSMAGAWAAFPAAWLAREVARHRASWWGRQPLVTEALRPVRTAITRDSWQRLLAQAEALRQAGVT